MSGSKGHKVSRAVRQRGQSAVETMFMIPLLLLVFMGMFELFTITFAAQNAHIRAREYVLHNGAYVPASRRPAPEAGSPASNGTLQTSGNPPLFDGSNYIVADPGIWGVSSLVASGGSTVRKGWVARSTDRGIPGVVTSSADRGTVVTAYAYICSPMGCPSP